MLVLPVDEDAWAFRLCLYVGLALLLLDVVLPRVFHRRVRLRWPLRRLPPLRLALPRARPLADDTFRRRKRELQQLVKSLEAVADDGASSSNAESDGATGDTRRRRPLKSKPTNSSHVSKKKKTKTKSRVVMAGDKTETEGEEHDASVRRAKKRVSFDTSRHEVDVSRTEPTRSRHYEEDEETKASDPPRGVDATGRSRERLDVLSVASVASTNRSPVASPSEPRERATTMPTVPPSRPDPFSLVDDEFPWQLPNYARTAQPSSLPSLPVQPATTVASSPGATLNVRRPLSQVNGVGGAASSASVLGTAAFTLELKHKPFWKRSPTKELVPSPAKSLSGASHGPLGGTQLPVAESAPTFPRDSFSSSSFTHSTAPTGSTVAEAPRLLFRPDDAFRPSPVPKQTQPNPFLSKRWRVPSPKPPLHSRPVMGVAPAAPTTSHISTPVAPQSRLRTPKIIRRITFDEDMMGALATPSDASPLVTQSTRKRQRENDVLEALDAVGLPWHKRRPNN